MRRVPKPTEPAGEVFDTCIGTQIGPALQEQLRQLKPAIEAADEDYERLGLTLQFYEIPVASLNPGIEAKSVSNIYDRRMVPKTSPGRSIYDKLILGAEGRICPLCGIGLVETLDHYLPKVPYWPLVVTPKNLVPACLHCNKAKQSDRPADYESQTIHPYYDDFQSHTWLNATVVEKAPPGITYEVINLENWEPEKMRRAEKHFSSHNLADLFIANAGNELSKINRRLADLYRIGGGEKVRAHLKDELSYCSLKNDWRTAMYKALVSSDWFCEEGCLLL